MPILQDWDDSSVNPWAMCRFPPKKSPERFLKTPWSSNSPPLQKEKQQFSNAWKGMLNIDLKNQSHNFTPLQQAKCPEKAHPPTVVKDGPLSKKNRVIVTKVPPILRGYCLVLKGEISMG